MFFLLSKIFDLLAAPLAWVLVLLGWAMFRIARRYKDMRVVGVLALAAIALYVTSIAPVSNRLLRGLESDAKKTAHDDVTYDVIVVLGGMVDEEATEANGAASYNNSIERLLVAYDLLRTDRAKNVILSSGAVTAVGPDSVESHVLARQLASWGIPESRIIIEDKSRNTRENAVECAKIIHERGFAKVLVTTSAFHVPRAAGCFRAVDLDVDFQPVDYRTHPPAQYSASLLPRAERLTDSTQALREYLGRLVYRLRGYAK